MNYDKCEVCKKSYFEVYPFCPYCHRVRKYLRDIHLNWLEIFFFDSPDRLMVYAWLLSLSGLIISSLLLFFGYMSDSLLLSFIVTLILTIIWSIIVLPMIFGIRMVTF